MSHRPLLSWLLLLAVLATLGLWLGGVFDGAPADLQPDAGPAPADPAPGAVPAPAARERRAPVASTAAPPPTAVPAAGEWVRGRVLDARDDAPVVAAACVDLAAPAAGTRSSETGTFAVRCRIPGAGGALQVSHPEYLPAVVAVPRSLVGADGVTGLLVRLWPQASAGRIEGKVVDARGAGLPAAALELRPLTATGRSARSAVLTFSGPEHLAADGRFALGAVAPGSYQLVVRHAGFEDHEATGLRLVPGGALHLGTIVLCAQQHGRLFGRVTRGGRPVAGATVEAHHAQRWQLTTTSAADGSYEIPAVPAGRVSTRVRWGSITRYGQLAVPAGAGVRHDIQLVDGPFFVGGRVRSGGAPAGGVEVTCQPPAGTHRGDQSWSVRTAADGRFRVGELPGGPVTVTVAQDDPYEIREYENIAVDRDDHEFELLGPLPRVRVHGRITDLAGRPVAGAVVSTHQTGALTTRGRADAAGDYELAVQLERDSSVLLLADAPGYVGTRRALSPSMVSGSSLRLDLVVASVDDTGEVSGRVLDPAGRGIAKALVLLEVKVAGTRTSRVQSTDSTGRFLVRGMVAGSLRLGARHRDYHQVAVAGTLESGGSLVQDITLQPRVRRKGQVEVRLADGSPAHGVTVDVWRADGSFLTGGVTDQGLCRLDGLPDRPVRVSCELPGYPRTSQRHQFDAGAGAVLVLQLRRGTGEVHGTVTDAAGRPRSGVEVDIEELGERGPRVRTYVYTDAAGVFRITGLPAGEYRLRSFPDSQERRLTIGDTAVEAALRIPK